MNLFSQERVENYFAECNRQLSDDINRIDIKDVNIEEKAQQLAEKYKLKVPTINKEGITSELNLEDINGHIYQENPNASYGRPDVVVTATFAVPITGNERYFGLLPSHYSQKSYVVWINNGELKFKVRTRYVRLDLTEEWKRFILTTSQDFVGFIESTLQNLAADFERFNSGLLPQITGALNQKKQDQDRKERLNNEINPFK